MFRPWLNIDWLCVGAAGMEASKGTESASLVHLELVHEPIPLFPSGAANGAFSALKHSRLLIKRLFL